MRVSITFTGVCAIAPGCPSHPDGDGKYRAPGPLRLTMPLSSRYQNQQSRRGEVDASYIPVHIPFILATTTVKAAKLGRGRPPDDVITESGHGWYNPPHTRKQSAKQSKPADDDLVTRIWLPMRERLEIRVDGEYCPGELTFERDDPAADVATVADMRRVWKGRAKFRGPCDPLWPISRGVDPGVLTQVVVPSGDVTAQFRKTSRAATFDPPKPKEDPPVHYPKLAPEVVISFYARHSVTIASRSLIDGLPIDSIHFGRSVGDELNLTIGNSDLRDLRARIEGAEIRELTADRDADYELYYTLLKDPDVFCADDDELPIPWEGRAPYGLIRNCYVSFVQ